MGSRDALSLVSTSPARAGRAGFREISARRIRYTRNKLPARKEARGRARAGAEERFGWMESRARELQYCATCGCPLPIPLHPAVFV